MGFLLACEMQMKFEMVRCGFFLNFALWHVEVWPLERSIWLGQIPRKITLLHHRAGKPETEVMFCRLKNTGGVGYTASDNDICCWLLMMNTVDGRNPAPVSR